MFHAQSIVYYLFAMPCQEACGPLQAIRRIKHILYVFVKTCLVFFLKALVVCSGPKTKFNYISGIKERNRMNDKNAPIIMYAAEWCPDAQRARMFFESHRVPYEWRDIDEIPDAKAYVKEVNDGAVVIPVIVFPDGSILVEPSNRALAQKLGMSD